MRIIDIRERTCAISRYADPRIPSGGLTTSLVAIVTDIRRGGKLITGFGFGSVGRFAQGGLIRERFAPRLLRPENAMALANAEGNNLDPFRTWDVMMAGEKAGGHGERCVAVGALDMAIWDAAAKIAELPLHLFLSRMVSRGDTLQTSVPVYAAGGYVYPDDDIPRLAEEMRRYAGLGFTRAKIKIGSCDPATDERRVATAAEFLPLGPGGLAVDAMNIYDLESGINAASRLARFGLWWFEDVCDPLDFDTQAQIGEHYGGAIAAGEALFSLAEAKLLLRYGGMRSARDFLVFDPVHCYGLPGYLRIVDHFLSRGWQRSAFWPHGGHLFSLHVAAALGLGGTEVNPAAFQPLCGLPDQIGIEDGMASLPDVPGIGFELRRGARNLFDPLVKDAS